MLCCLALRMPSLLAPRSVPHGAIPFIFYEIKYGGMPVVTASCLNNMNTLYDGLSGAALKTPFRNENKADSAFRPRCEGGVGTHIEGSRPDCLAARRGPAPIPRSLQRAVPQIQSHGLQYAQAAACEWVLWHPAQINS